MADEVLAGVATEAPLKALKNDKPRGSFSTVLELHQQVLDACSNQNNSKVFVQTPDKKIATITRGTHVAAWFGGYMVDNDHKMLTMPRAADHTVPHK